MKRLLVLVACVAACAAGAARGSAVGDVRVLVIRATWGPTPDNVATLQQAAPFYSRASFGQLRLLVDITPWLHPYAGAICPSDGEAAKAAARAAGYDVDSYARVAYVIPEQVCDFRGMRAGTRSCSRIPQHSCTSSATRSAWGTPPRTSAAMAAASTLTSTATRSARWATARSTSALSRS